MKIAHYLAAAALAMTATGAMATTITWNVAPAVEHDGTNPDTSPLSVSTYFNTANPGGSTIYFSRVLSAYVHDTDTTFGEPDNPPGNNPDGGDGNADLDDPTWTYVDQDSGFTNNFIFEFDGGPQITISEPGGLYDRQDQRDLMGGLFDDEEMRFFASRGNGTTATFGDAGFGIFWQEGFDTVLLAFSDRDAAVDGDFNDLWVSVNQSGVNVVPLPAAAWMLLAGLGGLVGVKRFRRIA